MFLITCSIFALDYLIGILECFIGFTFRVFVIDETIVLPVYFRWIFRKCIFDCKHGGKWFVLYCDLWNNLRYNISIGSDDKQNRFADIVHNILGEKWLVVYQNFHSVFAGDILLVHDEIAIGKFWYIDGQNFCSRLSRAQSFRIKHTIELHIPDISCITLYFLARIDTNHRLAYSFAHITIILLCYVWNIFLNIHNIKLKIFKLKFITPKVAEEIHHQ